MFALPLEYFLFLSRGPSTNIDYFINAKDIICRTQTKQKLHEG